RRVAAVASVAVASLGLLGCTASKVQSEKVSTDSGPPPPPAKWSQVFTDLPGALISVSGSASTDVWAVGSDTHDGLGPLILHYDGLSFRRQVVTDSGDLWWVHVFGGSSFVAGGGKGLIIRKSGPDFTRIDAPVTKGTVFGVWGSSE